LELVAAHEVLFVHGGDNEFGVIDGSRIIEIDLSKHLIDFSVVDSSSEILEVSLLQFILGKFTITIEIHGFEHFIDILFLILGEELRSDESKGGLLQLGLGVEVLQVTERFNCQLGVDGLLVEGSDPFVFQGLFSTWSLILVFGQKLGDEVLAEVRDVAPSRVGK